MGIQNFKRDLLKTAKCDLSTFAKTCFNYEQCQLQLKKLIKHMDQYKAGPQLGGGAKGGGAPLNKNFAPQTTQQAHPNSPFPCSSFKMVEFFFFGNQQRTQRKVDQIGAMTFF